MCKDPLPEPLLIGAGYKLVEDAWNEHGRRTYIHDDDATRSFQKSLITTLSATGWVLEMGKLRSFRHPESGHVIELEPGGSEVNGHFLHHMNKEQGDIKEFLLCGALRENRSVVPHLDPMNGSVIVWDLETVPDLRRLAAASGLAGKTDDEVPLEQREGGGGEHYHLRLTMIGAHEQCHGVKLQIATRSHPPSPKTTCGILLAIT
jgi:hypothetical protein